MVSHDRFGRDWNISVPKWCPCKPMKGDLPVLPALFPVFSFYVMDKSTHAVLPDAEFLLSDGNCIVRKSISGCDGVVWFPGLRPGSFQLCETASPPKYQLCECTYTVKVDAKGGVLINGLPAQQFVIFKQKEPIKGICSESDVGTILKYKETVTLSGEILWEDQDNISRIRPQHVEVHLYCDGMKVDGKQITATKEWRFLFRGLPRYDTQGREYSYTIDESEVPQGYERKVTDGVLSNRLCILTVKEVSYNSTNGFVIFDQSYKLPYSSDLTLFAPKFAGYQLISSSSHNIEYLTQDTQKTFYFQPLMKGNRPLFGGR